MNKEIKKIAKNLNGNVLLVGIEDEDLLNTLYNSKKIKNCTLLEPYKKNKKKLKIKGQKNKTINIKKLKKKFKHKTQDYIICDNEKIKKYYKTFIRDSVYINKNSLYIYGVDNDNLEDIIKKYKRYDVTIETKKINDLFLIKIDNQKSDNIWLRDKFYYLYDSISNIRNEIADILIS